VELIERYLSVGKYLERVRMQKKMSLREAAEKSGISYSYIRDIEIGKSRKTGKEVKASVDVLKRLAEAYDLDYADLLERAGYLDESMIYDAARKVNHVIREVSSVYASGVPLVGTICAGDGIVAEENIEDYVSYPLRSKTYPDFALRVRGDSMIGAQINDGDIVFFKSAKWAEYNGQIVAVVVNGEEGTLKRMYWSSESPKIKLAPENDEYKPIEVFPSEVIVCGVYYGHFRPVEGAL